MEMLVIPWWHLYRDGLLWPFLVFCDLCMMVYDGLWCKVQLLWILPYFVVFVTIMAFMVVQLGCSHFEFVSGDFHTALWFFSKGWMFWMGSDIFEYCNINFSCHSNIALWSAMI